MEFSLGLRKTVWGWLQTRSPIELTKSQLRSWDLPCKGKDGKEEICFHPFHSILSDILEILYIKAYFFFSQVKHSLREMRFSWCFWVFTLDPSLSFHHFVVNHLSHHQWLATMWFHCSTQVCYRKSCAAAENSCSELRGDGFTASQGQGPRRMPQHGSATFEAKVLPG